MTNKIVNRKQHTVSWNVNNLKFSHVNKNVNDNFMEWIKEKYGIIREVKVSCRKIHEYLGMTLDYMVKEPVTINMYDYVKNIGRISQRRTKWYCKDTLE